MDQDTQKNAAAAEQTTAVSHSLMQEAETLVSSVARFRLPAMEKQPADGREQQEKIPAQFRRRTAPDAYRHRPACQVSAAIASDPRGRLCSRAVGGKLDALGLRSEAAQARAKPSL